jgi:hypothetical protein
VSSVVRWRDTRNPAKQVFTKTWGGEGENPWYFGEAVAEIWHAKGKGLSMIRTLTFS